jgi:phosphatidylinositol-3-phosphatase
MGLIKYFGGGWKLRAVGFALVWISMCIGSGCGGNSASSSTSTSNPPTGSPPPTDPPPPPPPPPPPSVPAFGHVFLLPEENHSCSEVIGSSDMPYLNSLASKYGLATQYYANTHPSIGNYFMLTTGQIITNDDSYTGTVSADNIVRELIASGKSWKSYSESLPSAGYTQDNSYPYARRHNPFAYLSDVVNGSTQVNNLVPFSQFASDLANNELPDFSYIVPNLLDDAHDGTLPAADSWLQRNIAPLLASSIFQKDGLLIIVFDESIDSDTTNGGGHVAALIISPLGKAEFQSTTLYQHQSSLRLILEGLGVTTFPGASSTAPEMSEFF